LRPRRFLEEVGHNLGRQQRVIAGRDQARKGAVALERGNRRTRRTFARRHDLEACREISQSRLRDAAVLDRYLDAVDRSRLSERLDDSAQHRHAAYREEAFVAHAVSLGHRIQGPAAGRQDQRMPGWAAHAIGFS